MQVSDFTLEVMSDEARLHRMWLEYRNLRGLDGFTQDIAPHLRDGEEWARRLLGFSRTWFTGNQVRKEQWHHLMVLLPQVPIEKKRKKSAKAAKPSNRKLK